MTLLHSALTAVANFREAKLLELETAAAIARQENIVAHRAAAVAGVPEDSPLRPIAELVSATLVIGREDGYPAFTLPDATRSVLRQALAAGIIPVDCRIGTLLFHSDFSGLMLSRLDSADKDCNAWRVAEQYRRANYEE